MKICHCTTNGNLSVSQLNLEHGARRLGYCSPDTPTFDELCDTADDELFSKLVQLPNHVGPYCTHYYHHHPPPLASQRYNLRHRAHSLQLPEHSTQLSESNFLTRMLYKNTYAQVLKFSSLFSRPAFFLLTVLPFCFELLACILSCRNKRILID